jgi:group I intron endonuclease
MSLNCFIVNYIFIFYKQILKNIINNNIMGFIYKITNILTNKCYIGETKKNNPEARWNEHKRKIEKGIGCPALQCAVNKYGISNFIFKVLIICFDEDRYKFEIEYIQKYNSMVPNGYNLTKGGEGGGFYGKKHTIESKNKISISQKEFYKNNPEQINYLSQRQKLIMNSPAERDKIKNGMKNSEKWKQAKELFKIGNNRNRKHTEDSKNKIKESLKQYFNNSNGINIENHRNIMALSKGIKVQQCDSNNNVINTFNSLADATRQTGVSKASIQNGIKNQNILRCGFIWKKI